MTRRKISILGLVMAIGSGTLWAAPSAQWTGTVASISGDELVLVGVGDRFRVAGTVTEAVTGRSVLVQSIAPGSAIALRVGEREADGRFRVDAVTLQPKSPLTLTGRIDGVTSDRRHVTVHGVEVEVDDHTAFSGRAGTAAVRSARLLGAGMTARVTLAPTAAGTLRASEFRLTNAAGEPGEDREFKGTVSAISDTVWTIDDKEFTITDQTLFEGDPQVGDFVEVKFHLDADGNRIADRIELEDQRDDEVEFRGIVEAIGATSWTISGRVVAVNEATVILGSPMVGDSVEVRADVQADGTLLATRIKFEDEDEDEVEFTGRVESIGAESWTIAGQTIVVNPSTEIRGAPKVGDQVEVKARKAPDGTLIAERIKLEDSSGHDGEDDHGGNDGGDDHSGHDGGDDHGGGSNSGSNSGSGSGGNHRFEDPSDD